ncbi:MAG TPA: hypothetical protein VFB46_01115 [Gemmatimonadaceae bacterium]|nr:hypothetical protein [Gemmatimonadaceae bacterium]
MSSLAFAASPGSYEQQHTQQEDGEGSHPTEPFHGHARKNPLAEEGAA